MYDESRRYIFTNWTDRDFTGSWGGVERTVKAGDYAEVPEHLAFHFTKHLVDREIQKDGKDAYLGVEEIRAPYEAKTMTLIAEGVDSPALASLKAKIKEETQAEMKNSDVNVKQDTTEFAALKKKETKGAK